MIDISLPSNYEQQSLMRTGLVPMSIDDRMLQDLQATHQTLLAQIAAHTEYTHLLIHQLATPLMTLQGSIDLLKEPNLPVAQQAEFWGLLEQQVQQLQGLLQGVRAFRNLETGTMATHPVAFSLSDLLSEVCLLLPPHPVQDQFEPDLPSVWGDRWQVSQVILNLLSNAIKYSPQQTPIAVGAKVCRVGWVELWVRDWGLGIPVADQPRLFERFYRVKQDDRVNIKGTGLGLSLSKLLIEHQGGKLGFESVHGEGSRFYFTLPIAQ
jgi:signal transduction histidine kinase